jgi:hypothetical protein
MASIETAIRALLVGNSNVTDLVSTRIYPIAAPENATRPFVVYELEEIDPVDALNSYTGVSFCNVDIVVWSESYSTSKNVDEKIRAVLLDYSGTSDTIVIKHCRHDNTKDAAVWTADGKELPLYGVESTWRIMYNR